jgi:hypothetical protein
VSDKSCLGECSGSSANPGEMWHLPCLAACVCAVSYTASKLCFCGIPLLTHPQESCVQPVVIIAFDKGHLPTHDAF